MNPKLKYAAWMGIGMGIGTALYEFATAGSDGPEIGRAIFVGCFGFVVYLLIPMKSKEEEKK